MKMPNVFIVGHPKTGTSSLYEYLHGHPDVLMSAIKEPHFFSKDFHEESDRFHGRAKHFPFRNEKEYMKLYRKWKGEKVLGEASAMNLFSKVSAKEIWRFNPNAKIIIMLREPVDFLYSYHSTATFSLGEYIDDFRGALAAEEGRKSGKFLSRKVIVPSWLYYSELIKYSEQVTRFIETFPHDRLKVVIFDDFQSNTSKVFGEVMSFLTIGTNYRPDFRIVNPSQKVKWPSLKVLIESRVVYEIARRVLPNEFYAILVRYYKNMIVSYQAREKLNERVRGALRKRCVPEVEKISELLERDLLALWNYTTM